MRIIGSQHWLLCSFHLFAPLLTPFTHIYVCVYARRFSPLYVSRVADNLAEGRACAEDDSFCLLDPRARPGEVPVELKGQKYGTLHASPFYEFATVNLCSTALVAPRGSIRSVPFRLDDRI